MIKLRPEPILVFLIGLSILLAIAAFINSRDFFFTFTGEVLGGLLTVAAVWLILVYETKRDLALANVKEIYTPCHEEVRELIKMVESYAYSLSTLKSMGWTKIKEQAGGKFLAVSNPRVFHTLERLYAGLRSYDHLCERKRLIWQGCVYKAFNEMGKTISNPSQQAMERIPSFIESAHELQVGFIEGDSFERILERQKTTPRKYLDGINYQLRRTDFAGKKELEGFEFTPEFFAKLNECFGRNKEMIAFKRMRNSVLIEANEARRRLEREIINPPIFNW